MAGTPDGPREVLRFQTSSDLNGESLEEAIKMVQEREPDNYGQLTLMCSETEGRRLRGHEFRGSIPYFVFVPDELLKHPEYWALAGRRTVFIEDRNA